MVLTTPLLCAVREHYPEAELHVLASEANASLLECNTEVHKVWRYSKSLVSLPRLVWQLRREQFECWIDPKDEFSRTGAMFARWARASTRIGYNGDAHNVFTHDTTALLHGSTLQASERNLLSVQSIGIHAGSIKPKLCVKAESKEYVESFIQRNNLSPAFTLVNISAGNDSRRWEERKWVEVIGYLRSTKQKLCISAEPKHHHRVEEIRQLLPDIALFPSRSIHDVIALIQRSSVVISPDTSIVHIAAAFDVPVVGLYPNLVWNTQKFRPLSSISRVLLSDSPEHIHHITPQQVQAAIEEVRSERESRGQ